MQKLKFRHFISFLFITVLISSGCASTEVTGIQATGEIQMTISPPVAENNEKFGLQDLQVTIEVRFLTVTDNFFERIGVDFRGISGEQNVEGIGNFQFNKEPDTFSGGSIFKNDEEGFPFGESNVGLNLLMGINGQSIPLNGIELFLSDNNIMFLLKALEAQKITDVLGRPRIVTIDNIKLDITPIVGAAQDDNNLPELPENP